LRRLAAVDRLSDKRIDRATGVAEE